MNNPLAKLVCPYCYEPFRANRFVMRCTGRPGPNRVVCAPQLDTLLENLTGDRAYLPPTFERTLRNRRRGLRAACPDCDAETGYRVCPLCHSELPPKFGRINGRLIALVGARNTGKTVYMTVLFHEMRHRIGEVFQASVSGADEETRRRFAVQYEQPLYNGRTLPRATAPAEQRNSWVRPMVFQFGVPRMQYGRSRPHVSLLSFFDTAGEDLRTKKSLEYNARYLRRAHGIIVLLDPLQIPAARHRAAPDTLLPSMDVEPSGEENQSQQEHIIDTITEMLQPDARGKINKPIAIVLSKIDALQHDLPPYSPLQRQVVYDHGGPARYDTNDGVEVHQEVGRLLNDWDNGEITRHVALYYRRYRFFGVSALGTSPTADNAINDRTISPFRVADPLLWLLSEFRAIVASQPATERTGGG